MYIAINIAIVEFRSYFSLLKATTADNSSIKFKTLIDEIRNGLVRVNCKMHDSQSLSVTGLYLLKALSIIPAQQEVLKATPYRYVFILWSKSSIHSNITVIT